MTRSNNSLLMPEDIKQQSFIFGYYLIGTPPNKASQSLFAQVIQNNSQSLTAAEYRILRLVMRYPKFLSLVDAGLVVLKPSSEIRRRVYVMLGILECQPEYHTYFLPQERSRLYISYMGLVLIKSYLKTGLGILLLKVAGL